MIETNISNYCAATNRADARCRLLNHLGIFTNCAHSELDPSLATHEYWTEHKGCSTEYNPKVMRSSTNHSAVQHLGLRYEYNP